MFLFSFSSFFQVEIAIWVVDSISKVNLKRIACQWLLIENVHSYIVGVVFSWVTSLFEVFVFVFCKHKHFFFKCVKICDLKFKVKPASFLNFKPCRTGYKFTKLYMAVKKRNKCNSNATLARQILHICTVNERTRPNIGRQPNQFSNGSESVPIFRH